MNGVENMLYENILSGVFLSRPNRFTANILIDGREEKCHVKNTGRCGELLIQGSKVYVQKCTSETRKTKFDLISVYKGQKLINIDSSAPNRVFGEFLAAGGLGFDCHLIRPETLFGDSRFDFYFEHNGIKAFAELKGVTLEENGVLRFPDAPTQRGVKHLRSLISAAEQGYEAYCVFIIQMDGAEYLEPNRKTHPEFAEMLVQAKQKNVHLLAYDCIVFPDKIEISQPVRIRL